MKTEDFAYEVGDLVIDRSWKGYVSNHLFGFGWKVVERRRGWFGRKVYVLSGKYSDGSDARITANEKHIMKAPR